MMRRWENDVSDVPSCEPYFPKALRLEGQSTEFILAALYRQPPLNLQNPHVINDIAACNAWVMLSFSVDRCITNPCSLACVYDMIHHEVNARGRQLADALHAVTVHELHVRLRGARRHRCWSSRSCRCGFGVLVHESAGGATRRGARRQGGCAHGGHVRHTRQASTSHCR